MDFSEAILKHIRRVFDRRAKAGDIDADLWRHNSRQLLKAIEDGMGATLESVGYGDDRLTLMQTMRKNALTFSAFKNHHNTQAVVQALADPHTGRLRSWSEFRQAALKISTEYNVHWLQAEYNSAMRGAQMADRWREIDARKDVLPWLTYMTQQDSAVRESHAALHGVTKHVDDPFWDEYYPPNGWNCRCYVLQKATGRETSPERLPTVKESPPAFRTNPGRTGELWSPDHPYYRDAQYPGRITGELRKVLAKEDVYDRLWQDTDTGATVRAHITHDNPDEFAKNFEFAKRAARRGVSVDLLATGNEKNKVYPDMKINGRWIEYRDTGKTDSFDNVYARAREKAKKLKSIEGSRGLALNLSGLKPTEVVRMRHKILDLLSIDVLYVRVGDEVTEYLRP